MIELSFFQSYWYWYFYHCAVHDSVYLSDVTDSTAWQEWNWIEYWNGILDFPQESHFSMRAETSQQSRPEIVPVLLFSRKTSVFCSMQFLAIVCGTPSYVSNAPCAFFRLLLHIYATMRLSRAFSSSFFVFWRIVWKERSQKARSMRLVRIGFVLPVLVWSDKQTFSQS